MKIEKEFVELNKIEEKGSCCMNLGVLSISFGNSSKICYSFPREEIVMRKNTVMTGLLFSWIKDNED